MDVANFPVAAIIPYRVFPAQMGGQKGIALFYQHLSSYLQISMVCTSDTSLPEGFPAKGYPILGTGIERYTHPGLVKKIARVIKNSGAKVLIIEHPYLGWLARILKKRLGISVIVHSHNIEYLRFKSVGKWWWPFMRIYEKQIHRMADMSFFVTDEDRAHAITHFQLNPNACATITYGLERAEPPKAHERKHATDILRSKHQIPENHRILLFNGTLCYKPNLDALHFILNEINPILLKQNSPYTIIICGKDLPKEMHDLSDYKDKNIIYAGFVDDIELYYLGAQIFLNPIIEGGGIKTKLVEALGYNLCVISTKSGAIGVSTETTAHKMVVVDDKDWITFVNALEYVDIEEEIPQAFFNRFYWGNIAKKAAECITKQA